MKKHDFDNISLPKVNPNENLETISNNFFRPLLDVNKFEIRSETVRDKGIDFHIELKKGQSNGDKVYTNFRFAVQLKSTDSVKANTDGSFSIQIYSSNINYLLNNGMPAFYVLYHKLSHSFYYESVNNFFVELQKKDTNWSKKEKHSLKFSKLLDNKALSEIYQETFDNGLLFRQLNQHLKFPVHESISSGIIIDQKKDVYSVAENIAYLDQFGHELINRYHFDIIIEIEQKSHPRTEVTPRFNLICGIAYFRQGNLYRALELLKLAQKKIQDFEPEIQAMLMYTLLNAKYLLGIINKSEFDDELVKITEGQNSGVFFEIEKAYNILTSNKVKSSEGIKVFYHTINNIIKKEKNNTHLKINAYAKILEAEAVILLHDLTINFTYFIGRVKKPLESKAYLEWLKLEEVYLQRLENLISFALKKRYFLGVSNLLSAKIMWNYKKIFHSHLLNNWKGRSFNLKKPLDAKDLESLMKNCEKLDKILSTYEMLEHHENMISCLNNKYEIQHYLGQKEALESTKNKVIELIESYDFAGLKPHHSKLISGMTPHEKFIKNYTDHINRIQNIAIENGLDIYSDLPEEVLNIVGRKPEWSIDNFLEFDLSN